MSNNTTDELSVPLLAPACDTPNQSTQPNTDYNGLGGRQLYALGKKNILLRIRNPLVTLIELLSPLSIVVLIIIGYSYSLHDIRHTDQYIFTDPNKIIQSIATFQSGLLPNIQDWVPNRPTTHCIVLPMAVQWMFCFDTEADRDMLYAITSYNGPTPIPSMKQYVSIAHTFSTQFGNISDTEVLQKMNQLNLLVDGQFTNLLFLGELWFVTNTQCNTPHTPCNININEINDFIQFMSDTVDGMNELTIRIFDNEQAALQAIDTLNPTQYIWAIINIHSFDLYNNIDYSIRMNHSVVPDTYKIHDRFNIGLDDSFKEYLFSGFTTLQITFDNALYNYTNTMNGYHHDQSITNTIILPYSIVPPNNITITPFPIPSYKWNKFYETMGPFLGLLLVMCYMIPVSLFVKQLVDDKESRMKEVMRVMGMIDWTYTVSYHLVTSIIFIMSAILFTTVLHHTFLSHISYTVLLVFMVLHVMTLVNYCFMLSTWFSKGKIACILTPILMFVCSLPHYAYYNGSDSMISDHTMAMTVISLIFSPTGFIFGCDMLIRYESASITLSWSNIFADEYSMGRVFILLALNFIIYGISAWYFENILPNEYGSNLSPYFMFTPSYWCTPTIDDNTFNIYNHPAESPNTRNRRDTLNESDNNSIEHVSDTMIDKARLKIRQLRKVFTSGYGRYKQVNVAVHGLNLTLYADQITSLLGQNGAGKTTTISMLTGLMCTTSGCIQLDEYNHIQHMKYMRRHIGICAQSNTLYGELTVYEQLELFATLKNVPTTQLHNTVVQIISDVGLTHKTHCLTSTLSGGQQRKVCVAQAFIGGSNIVFLDEPTTGMDPLSRRSTWDILKSYKRNRVILLTTHFLDEADLLSDRIAVMCNGKLQCVGSSLFLKSRYGIGYNLTLVKTSRRCDIEQLNELIYAHISDAVLLATSGNEVSYQLPLTAVSLFADLFTELELNRSKLYIGAYGISMTSLEEVFLNIIDTNDNTINNNMNNTVNKDMLSPQPSTPLTGRSRTVSNVSATSSIPPTPLKKRLQQQLLGDIEYMHGIHSNTIQYNTLWTQFNTLMHKRYIVAVRDPLARFIEIIMPLLTIIIVLCIFNLSRKSSGIKLQLSTSMYANVGINYEEKSIIPININSRLMEPDTLNYMSMSNDYTIQWTNDISCVNMSEYLLATAFINNDNRYGAIMFNDTFELDFKHSPIPFGPRNKEYILNFPINIMHNTSFYHSVPILVNEINSARYNSLHNTSHIRYTIHSHPLPAPTHPTIKQQTFLSLLTAAFILLPFCYIPASYATFIVNERVQKIKHIQLLCGVNSMIYWCVVYLFDIINYLFVSSLVMLVLILFNNNLYVKSWINVVATSTALMLYGTSVIPLSYIYSTLFHTNASAQIGIMSLHFVFGFILTIVSFMFDFIESLNTINGTLKLFYRVFPAFNLGEALINISINELKNSYTGSNTDVFSRHVIGTNIVCMAVQSVVYMVVPLILETQIIRQLVTKSIDYIFKCMKHQPTESYEYDDSIIDDDVLNERLLIERDAINTCNKQQLSSLLIDTPGSNSNRVSDALYGCNIPATDHLDDIGTVPSTTPSVMLHRSLSLEIDNVVKINSLCKSYPNNHTPIVAVQSLSLGIRRGECFGLLGINGAGKTTTMKMLTGDILPSSGDATINGYSIVHDINHVRKQIAYCPQFDALIDCMTAREQLTMYAKYRGNIKPSYIARYVAHIINRLKLDQFADCYSGTYSGGNKRKLSLAIALIGAPSVIMLDEPSSGMDPVSRRFMWNVISSLSDTQQSSILTSHSMNETEALCQRIGIMIHGKLRCIGSIQHLKYKFGRGYNIEFNSQQEYIDTIQRFVKLNFTDAELIEYNTTRITFALSKSNTSLPQIFSLIEQNKYQLHIDDYSVSQTSLEQVFLSQAIKSV